VLNLVQNAGDAMRARGTGTITIDSLFEGSADRVVLIVADDGPGMSPHMRERCMQPFVSSKSGEGSIGLGLAIVYDLVTRAGGSVQVDSELGKGSTFRLSIPGSPRRDRALHDTVQAHSGL
jgi:signal transduction histidine kinase